MANHLENDRFAAGNSPKRPGDSMSQAIAPPTLTSRMMNQIASYGQVEEAAPGAMLFTRGSRSTDFFVVIDGMIELREHKRNGGSQVMTTLTKGQFSGELDLLSGREVLLSCRAVRWSKILRIGAEGLRQLMRAELDVADLFIEAWIGRRADLVQHAQGGVIMIGYGHDAETTRTQQFLVRNGYPNKFIDADTNANAQLLLAGLNLAHTEMPVVFLPDHRILRKPSNAALAEELGMTTVLQTEQVFDVAIVGAGPSGLAAALYAASEGP
jgi:thioredoxin reductase (NADPH)